MKQFSLMLAGLALLSACSNRREERIASTDRSTEPPDLTLPDTVSRRDTSLTVSSSSDQPASPVEQHATRPVPPAPRPTQPVRPKRARQPVKPATPPADTSVRAYAPNPLADTAIAMADTTRTVGTGATDTAVVASRAADSSATPADTSTRADSSTTPDTTRRPATDSMTSRTSDTLASRASDTTTTRADSAASPASAAVSPAASSASASTAAARTLPIGTEIHAALDDSITSRRDTVGRTVSAHVMENVVGADGKTLIAAGTPVQLTVTRPPSLPVEGVAGTAGAAGR